MLIYNLLKEKDARKNNFLALVALFNFVSYILIIPVISSMAVSYFIILLFVPFVLLGLMFRYIEENMKLSGIGLILFLAAVLMIFSLQAEKSDADLYVARLDNNVENSDLGAIEDISAYILDNSSFAPKIYLSGRKDYLNRFSGSLTYMIGRQGRQLVSLDISDSDTLRSGQTFFYVQKSGKGSVTRNEEIGGYAAVDGERIGGVEIYILKK
ncbi:MAG: hypothetical protein P4L62_03665 [Candidatus Pacebacteria bacterium]|nr:hypothetical protein [Candidatus Paceibacterota bacterium]